VRPAAWRVKMAVVGVVIPPSAADLIRVQRLVANEQQRVAAQRVLIASLRSQSRDTEAAERQLEQMLSTLAVMEETRDRIKAAVVVANQNSK
jgi:hypothetical protein